ncbi:MAG: hypothetical protein PHI63_01505 [Patescibacteria group bacterium]|nr:hypothetical protein [Patescibacteria group bacterium]
MAASRWVSNPADLRMAWVVLFRTLVIAAGFMALWLISPQYAWAPATLMAVALFVISWFGHRGLRTIQFCVSAVALAALSAVPLIRAEPLPRLQKIGAGIALLLLLIAADPLIGLLLRPSAWKRLGRPVQVAAGFYHHPTAVAWATEMSINIGAWVFVCCGFGLIIQWSTPSAIYFVLTAMTGFIVCVGGRILIPELRTDEPAWRAPVERRDDEDLPSEPTLADFIPPFTEGEDDEKD